MTKIVIMAAGTSSRFGKTKCLVKINEVPIIVTLVSQCIDTGLPVEVVCNSENITEIRKVLAKYNVTIKQNMHLENLRGTAIDLYYTQTLLDNIILLWSDIIIVDEQRFKTFINTVIDSDFGFALPVVNEPNPYAAVITDTLGNPIDFIYYKDYNTKQGYHDQCIFYINANVLGRLCDMINQLKYLQELSALNLLKVAYSNGYKTKQFELGNMIDSFNTEQELYDIVVRQQLTLFNLFNIDKDEVSSDV